MKTLLLNGEWQLNEFGSAEKYNATVPGCNFTDLIENNVIPEPYENLNEEKCFEIYKKDWEYSRFFNIEENDLSHENIYLVAEMLDTLADISINGKHVSSTNNMHRTYRLDIKNYTKSGSNEIKIVFYSPEKYILERSELLSLPNNAMGLKGCPHVRKSPCHFGWDFAPTLPPAGISRDIYIEFYDSARIDTITLEQVHEKEAVTLKTTCLLECDSNFKGTAKISLVTPDEKTEVHSFEFVGKSADYSIKINNPKLWWPNGIGDQPLYKLFVELINDNSEIIDDKCLTIGLRQIELNTEKDEFGENFCFIVNKIPVFAKGANFIPPDIFRNRVSYQKLYNILMSAKTANMNMIRVWGGGYYESNDFYNICDELGILVWQDMNFACSAYPFDLADFTENVLAEIKDNINRIRNHPCLALYSGNNEIESMSMAWRYRTDIIKSTGKFFYQTLPEEIRKFDKITPYWACTPSSGEYMKKVNSDLAGDTHLWHVWHGLRNFEFYRKRFTRFCSEFGLESYPTLPTLKKFIDEEKLYFGSDEIQAHQKCVGGDVKMLYYLLDRYWKPADFYNLVYLTQLSQTECIRDASEHWHRNMNRCHGSLYWQFNDCWCGTSWASLDYLGGYKALHYAAKHFNEPISLSIENKGTNINLYTINDTRENVKATLEWTVETFDGKILKQSKKSVVLSAVKSEITEQLSLASLIRNKKNQTVFVAKLYDESNQLLSERRCLFSKEKNCKFSESKISYTLSENIDDEILITLHAPVYSRYVHLEVDNETNPFSDNYFDMSANEKRSIYVKSSMNKEEFSKHFTAVSLFDVKPVHSRTYDKLNRAKIFLHPWNLANWFSRFFDK